MWCVYTVARSTQYHNGGGEGSGVQRRNGAIQRCSSLSRTADSHTTENKRVCFVVKHKSAAESPRRRRKQNNAHLYSTIQCTIYQAISESRVSLTIFRCQGGFFSRRVYVDVISSTDGIFYRAATLPQLLNVKGFINQTSALESFPFPHHQS